MGLEIKRGFASKYKKIVAASIAVFALVAQPLVSTNIPEAFATGEVISISSVAELRSAIENQADGQTWTIQPGTYGLTRFNGLSAEGQTGWYFPITANNLTINGIGNPTLYGAGYSANGNWSSQNFVSVFGDNVTISGLTLMPKVQPNKTIEVLGTNFTLRNSIVTPNTLTDSADYAAVNAEYKQWGGSVYFNNAGSHTLENVTLKNSGVSYRYSPTGTTIAFVNTKIVNTSNVDWINTYRYSSVFNNPGNSVTGAPVVEYHTNSTLNNLTSALNAINGGEQLVLDSDLSLAQQATVTKPITIVGNGHAVRPTFTKTNNSNNAAFGIQSNNVTVNNIIIDGTDGTNLHGFNIFQSTGVALNNVTSKNNDYSGIGVNGSAVTVSNVTTEANGWHGINVDKPGAVLTVNGTSNHTDTLPIYVDSSAVGQVIDTNSQYGTKNNVLKPGDRVYRLLLAAPTIIAPENNSYTSDPSFDNVFSKVSGATKYEYETTYASSGYYADNSDSSNYDLTGENVIRHNNGAPEATYKWHVRAVDALGIAGPWSAYVYVTVDTTKPSLPVLQTPANNALINYNEFWFEWNDAAGATKYEFQASQSSVVDSNGSLTSNVWHGDASGNEPTDSRAWSAGATGTWYWQVRSVDNAGNKSAWTIPWKLTIDKNKPSAPQITSPTQNQEFDGEPGTIRATWIASVDDTSIAQYQIEYVYTRNGNPTIDYREVTGSQLYRDQSLSGAVLSDFTIRVRAKDSANNWSNWSDPVTYYYGVDAPTVPPTDPEEPVDPVDPSEPTDPPITDPETPATGTPSTPGSGPTIPVAENENEDNDNEDEDGSNTSQQLAQLFVPGSATILGVQDQDDDSNADGGTPLEAVDEDVLGTTAEPKAASTSELGFMGLAWYWWLTILAALIGLWWFIAARRRQGASE